ncbi:MAG: EamA family transporter [Ferruginibacter sp.]
MLHKNVEGKGKAYFAVALTSIIWGTTWVASKIGIGDIPAIQMAAIRQFLAGAGFILIFFIFNKLPLPTAKQWKWLIVMSILMFVFANGLSTLSLQYIPTGLSALIGALYPLSVVIIERIFFKAKKITPLTLIGFILGIGGIGIVFYENAFDSKSIGSFIIGLILSVIAMLSWSVGTIFMARNKAQLNPYYATGWQMLIGSVFLFFYSIVTQKNIPLSEISVKGWLVIFYLVVIGSTAFVAFIYSMKKLPMGIASLYAYFNPLIAIITAGIILNEKLTLNILWGAIVTVIGVFLVNYSIKRDNNKTLAEPEM